MVAVTVLVPIEVGIPVARHPPHRSRHAVFSHRALRNGSLTHALPIDNAAPADQPVSVPVVLHSAWLARPSGAVD